jgi:hypothetical protein
LEVILHVLAIPLGILVLVAIIFVAGLIAGYTAESLSILLLIVIGYYLGVSVLGLSPVF